LQRLGLLGTGLPPVLVEEETSVDARVSAAMEIEPIERETIRKVAWRLLPVIMLGYFCSYLDRVNVGMAASTMNHQLGFSNAVFGFGAGLFFLGYFLAEVPSNLIMQRVGARIWIARILITWGIMSGLNAFVWNDWSFYFVRFFLGVAEAGFAPGVALYFTWWFPSYYRSRMMAIYLSASVISMIIGPPIGSLLLQMDGVAGLHGWQWLFVIEAVPSVVMCFVTWFLLTDRPTDAAWLTPEQRMWLGERLAAERAQREAIRKFSLGEVFYNVKVWLLAIAFVGPNVAGYAMLIFLPLIVKGLGVPTNMVGLVSAIPFLFAFVAMIAWGFHSDRTGERTWHVAGSALLFAVALSACVVIGAGHPVVTMIALIGAAMGFYTFLPIFWSLPTAMLTGSAAAAGFGLVNAVANLGGFFGPWIFGLVKDATGSDNIALFSLALAPVISAVILICMGHDRRLERIPSRPR
jgi:ACS family tartrate transporter-like MFS transporter